jgi:cytochrome P450
MAGPITHIPAFDIDELPLDIDRTRGWQQLLAAGEVVRSRDKVALTSSRAVEFAATRPDLFSSAKASDFVGSPVPMVPIAIDPPDHTRFRRLLDPYFGPKRMAEREPELRRQARELIDGIIEKGECELIADLAQPFPSQVFLTLFGLPLEDRDKLVRWKNAILQLVDPLTTEVTEEVMVPALELYTFLTEHISQRQAAPRSGDLLSQLLTLEDGGLTDPEILGLCFLFVLAGLDTVSSSLGFAFANLATNPDLRRQISNDFTLIPSFIEENLRIEVPVPLSPRVTTEDVEVEGVLIPKDTSVVLMFGSANRDARTYVDPDTVNLGRRATHFAFGRGPHRCLGSHLARLELRLILEEWHTRIPDYELAAGGAPRAPWPAGTLGLDALPLNIRP